MKTISKLVDIMGLAITVGYWLQGIIKEDVIILH